MEIVSYVAIYSFGHEIGLYAIYVRHCNEFFMREQQQDRITHITRMMYPYTGGQDSTNEIWLRVETRRDNPFRYNDVDPHDYICVKKYDFKLDRYRNFPSEPSLEYSGIRIQCFNVFRAMHPKAYRYEPVEVFASDLNVIRIYKQMLTVKRRDIDFVRNGTAVQGVRLHDFGEACRVRAADEYDFVAQRVSIFDIDQIVRIDLCVHALQRIDERFVQNVCGDQGN
jgi:hypothetical protein